MSWDYLNTKADAWNSLADTWEHAFNEVRDQSKNPGGTEWVGKGAESFQDRADADAMKARGPAEMLRQAAKVAKRGYDTQEAGRRQVLDAVDEAQRDGFNVADDGTATDAQTDFSGPEEYFARKEAAQHHTEFIKWHMDNLGKSENEIAHQMTTATTGLHEFSFGDEGEDGGAGAMGSRIAGTGGPLPREPAPSIPPPLAPGPNDDDWVHGGDRRLTSQATAPLKEVAVLAAGEEEMTRNHQPTAKDMLEHYLDNSGTQKELPPELLDSWLSDGKNGYPNDQYLPPSQQVVSNVSSITQRAYEEARRTGTPVSLTGNTPWQVVAGSDGDAVRTLGHYSLSTAYKITMNPDGTYALDYRNDVYDWYNFKTSPYASSATQQISSWAHDLQAAGRAQDFLITGSSSVRTIEGAVH